VTPCRELFSRSGLSGLALQEAVEKGFPNGECEAVSISEHSPGPVSEAETLVRLVFHPIHVDESTGRILSVAFTDAWRSDLSVFRDERATDTELIFAIDQMKQTGASKTPQQKRYVAAVMLAGTGAVRAQFLQGTSNSVFRVYNTAEAAKPHHASIFLTQAARSSLSEKSIRKRLFELFTTADHHYRGGRLVAAAPAKVIR